MLGGRPLGYAGRDRVARLWRDALTEQSRRRCLNCGSPAADEADLAVWRALWGELRPEDLAPSAKRARV